MRGGWMIALLAAALLAARADRWSEAGVVTAPDGVVVTCAGAVLGAETLSVEVNARRYVADLLAVDAGRDLAVLQLRGAEKLGVLPLADPADDDLGLELSLLALDARTGRVPELTRGLYLDRLTVAGQHTLVMNARGGPAVGAVLNARGEVVGLVNPRLRAEPDTVCLATAPEYLLRLLNGGNIPFARPAPDRAVLNAAELRRRAIAAFAVITAEGARPPLALRRVTLDLESWRPAGNDGTRLRTLAAFLARHDRPAAVKDGALAITWNRRDLRLQVRDDGEGWYRLVVSTVCPVRRERKSKDEREALIAWANHLNQRYDLGQFFINADGDLVVQTHLTFSDLLAWNEVLLGLDWFTGARDALLVDHEDEFLPFLNPPPRRGE